MSAAHDGGPAFPTTMQHDLNGEAMTVPQPGMSLRDHFAGLAMQGWLASFERGERHPITTGNASWVASVSYQMADAMLEARK